MGVPPPAVPESLLEGWRLIEEREEVPFRAGAIAVEAHAVVYEDAERRREFREAIGPNADVTWRFYFASRVRIRPRVPTSIGLTRLVESNAATQFERDLRDREFGSVSRTGRRTLEVGGTTARVKRFGAVVSELGVGVDVASEAYLAVVPADREYVVAGGAYPTEVVGAGGGDGGSSGIESETRIQQLLRPEADRKALVRLIRSTA